MGTKDFSNGGLAGIVFACVIFVYLIYRVGVYCFDGNSFAFVRAMVEAVPAHWRDKDKQQEIDDIEATQYPMPTRTPSGPASSGSFSGAFSPRGSVTSAKSGGEALSIDGFASPRGARTPRAPRGPCSSMWVDGVRIDVPDSLSVVDPLGDPFFLLHAKVDCVERQVPAVVAPAEDAEESVEAPVIELKDGQVGEFELSDAQAAAVNLDSSLMMLSCAVVGECGVPSQLTGSAVALENSNVDDGNMNQGRLNTDHPLRTVVRFQIRVRDSNNSYKFNVGNYGLKVLCVGDAEGIKIVERIVNVLPDDSVRPPDNFDYADALTGMPIEAPVTLTTARDGKFASVVTVPRGVPTKVLSELSDGLYEFSPVIAKYDTSPQKLLAFRGLRREAGSTHRLFMHPTGSLKAGQVRIVLSWTDAVPLSLHVASAKGEHVYNAARTSGALRLDLAGVGNAPPHTATLSVEAGVEYRVYVSVEGSAMDGARLERSGASLAVYGISGFTEMRITKAGCRYEAQQGYWLAFKLLDGRVTLLNWIVESALPKKSALRF